jgi:predicted Zn-dependent protease
MNRLILSSSALATILICSACETMPTINNFDLNRIVKGVQNAKDAVVDVSEEQELEIGQGIASNLLGTAPLLANQKVQRYVNSVGRWLAMQTERPDLPWTFVVLDDKDVNAFAAPGGYIVITKGLLLRMRNEAELAGVLAHEISHVLRKHHLQAIKKAAGSELANDLLRYGAEQRGVDSKVLKLASAGTELYTRGLDKDDELEADRMGVVIAARAGYNPYGLPAFLQTLQSINPSDPGLALMFKTHPTFTTRIASLENVMGKPFDRFENQPDVSSRFKNVIGTLDRR